MKKLVALTVCLLLIVGLTACGGETGEKATYTVGICNYVDDASLNQIADNIQARIKEIAAEKGVTVEIRYDNGNADANVINQIIANFLSEDVDLMIGIATPVAMAMQAATDGTDLPVVFSAVSDPVGVELVESLEAPGANVTGTSDYLNTNALMQLMQAVRPKAIQTVGLLYDVGQDSSAAPIKDAKDFLTKQGIAFKEYTGTNVDEINLAVASAITDKVDAVFTPTDNTVMQAELSFYEDLAAAGIPHYAGADSFALNGAFIGYGVDYANLGRETADMAMDILLNGKDTKTMPVKTFDNGTATINTDICKKLGYDIESVKAAITPYCTKVETLTTAESF